MHSTGMREDSSSHHGPVPFGLQPNKDTQYTNYSMLLNLNIQRGLSLSSEDIFHIDFIQ